MERPHLVSDMQASAPPVELSLSRAGVTGVQKAIRIRRGDAETVMAADIECTVDLARGQKGVHRSRVPEVVDEAIGDTTGVLDLHFQLAAGPTRIDAASKRAMTSFEDANVLIWTSPDAPVTVHEEEGWFAW